MQVFKTCLAELSLSFPDSRQIEAEWDRGISLEPCSVHPICSLGCCLMMQKFFCLCGIFFDGVRAATLVCCPTWSRSSFWASGCQEHPSPLHRADESHFWPRSHSSPSTERSMWSRSCTSTTCGGSGSGMRRWGMFSLLIIPSTFVLLPSLILSAVCFGHVWGFYLCLFAFLLSYGVKGYLTE